VAVVARPARGVTVGESVADGGIGTDREQPHQRPVTTPDRSTKGRLVPVVTGWLVVHASALGEELAGGREVAVVDRHHERVVNDRLVVVGDVPGPGVRASIRCDAVGMATLPTADDRVSPREAEVLGLVAEHMSNAEIAASLYISLRTVESHVSSLLRKLGAADRRELARRRPSSMSAGERSALPSSIELLADSDGFVGRANERVVLREQWQLACAGHALVVFVTGEAGMGKSRIVAEFAAEIHGKGGRVLLGACHEDLDEPYGPFAEAFVSDGAHNGSGRGARSVAVALAGFGLDPGGAALSGAAAWSDDSDRDALPDGIRRWLVASATSNPLLLVIEDLHWASSTTRDVLRHIVRAGVRVPLLIVVTTRDSKPDLDAKLELFLAELQRAPTVARVTLRGLDRYEVAQLTGTEPGDVDMIITETGGNPLLVTHLRSAADGGSLPLWLRRRDQLLDDEARALLDQAAAFGTEFDADLLATAHRTPLLTVLENLEAAEEAGLVVPQPGRRAGFAFVHALFRSDRYASLPLRRRLELHARAAAALGARPDDERMLSERARHACLAVPVADAREAVALALAAAQHDEAAFAYDEAIGHYRRGLEAARLLEPPDSAMELDLHVRIAAACHQQGDPQGLPLLLDAARKAHEVGDTTSLVRAATAIPQFGAVGFVNPMSEGRAITEAALDALGDEVSPDRARLMMDLASHWLFVDLDRALELARRAEQVARDLDDLEVLGDVLLAARHLFSHPARIGERVRIGDELELLGRRLGRLSLTLAGLGTQAAAHLERSHFVAWIDGFDRFTDLLGDRSLPFFQLQATNYQANRALLSGDLARAEELASLTVPLSRGIGADRVYAEGTIVTARRLQNRDGELVARYERAAARSSDAWYRCTLAAVQARSGQIGDARTTMATLQQQQFPIRQIYPWSLAVTDLAEAAEVADDPKVAAHVLVVAAPYSGRIAVSGPCINRPFDQALAQAALAVGDFTAAVAYADRAVTASRKRRTPVFLARELVFLAEALRRSGESTGAVGPLVNEARTFAERFGLGVVTADIDRYALPG
jgi:DNA-binding CsgD family transcriptional regulator/tetratricopeptide (TPR) repeat protein